MASDGCHDVFDDLGTEYAAFDATLSALTTEQWSGPTLCEGWDVRDLVCHLWLQAEVAGATTAGDPSALPGGPGDIAGMHELIDRSVRERRDVPGPEVWRRWRERRAQVVAGLRSLPGDARVRWTVSDMAPATLATTLLMEAWAHGYDVREPLGEPQTVTPGMRHVAWFASRTLPFAFRQAGEDPVPVRFELRAPDGGSWVFGPEDTDQVVTGSAMELCLRSVRRLELEDAETLTAHGDAAATALRVVQCYP